MVLSVLLIFTILKILKQNGKEKVHQEQIANDHQGNEVKIRQQSTIKSSQVVMHNILPVLSQEADKDTDNSIQKGVKVEIRWFRIWCTWRHYEALLIKLNFILKQLHSKKAVYKYYD